MAWLKRLATPKWWPIEKKTKKFVAVPRGPHRKLRSLPLLIVLREVLKYAETAKEAKTVITRGDVVVDGRRIKDPNFGVGVFDVIELPKLKISYRVIPSKYGLQLLEVDDPKLKICKIIDKKILKQGRIQLNLDCGRNLIADKQYKTSGSVLIELPKQNIVQHFELGKGSLVIVTEGSNAGLIAPIKELEKDKVWLESDKKLIEVPKKLITVVGKERPTLKLE